MKKKKTAARKIKKHLNKKVYTTAVTLGLTAGAVVGVAAYQSSQDFTPSGENRDLNANQVLFPYDEGDNGLDSSTKDEKDSALLDKSNTEDQLHMADDASFLFDNSQYTPNNPTNQMAMDDSVPGDQTPQGSAVAIPGTTDAGQTPDTATGGDGNTTTPDEIYDIVDDPSKADTIISNPTTDPTPGNTDVDTGNGDTGNGDKGNGSGDGENNGSGNGNATGDNGSHGSSNGNGSGNSSGDHKNDSNSGNNNSSGDNTDKPSKPSRPSDTAKDPVISIDDKKAPAFGSSQDDMWYQQITENTEDTIGKNTEDDILDDNGNYTLVVTENTMNDVALYAGATVSATDVFYMMQVFILSSKDQQTLYWFGSQSYGKYFQVDGLSFDGGKTWNTDFPVTIPEIQEENILIRFSWRVSQKNAWVQTEREYAVKPSCLYILRKRITNENETISEEDILNKDDFWTGKYPEVGTDVMLLGHAYADAILDQALDPDGERLTSLFPGWTERDSALFWTYTTTAGRHILEPADMVPLDKRYIVKKKDYWMTADLHVDDSAWNLGVLQTLTGLEGEFSLWSNTNTTVDTLDVPKYIQAVQIAEGTPVTANTLKVPDTVLYIATDEPSMIIKKAYVVDADNPNYTSDVQGVLWNKEMTQMLGIPYECHTLEVPAGTEKVQLSYLNQLRRIVLDTEADSAFPVIDFGRLNNCQLMVSGDRLFDFFEEEGEKVPDSCTISAVENQERRYTVSQDMAVDQDDELFYLFSSAGASFTVPGEIRSIAGEAFVNATRVSTLILKDGEDLILRKDCLKNSRISQIVCATQEQFDSMAAQLSVAGEQNADGQKIELQLSTTTADGFSYYTEGTGDKITTTLIHVPQDLQTFDGTIGDGEITVDVIGASAFSGSDVQWVTLPEQTKKIGYRAFKNCEKLEGILINASDEITIGNQAFEDCPSLRFVASNALQATMEDDYDPLIVDQYYSAWQGNNNFFVLPDAIGYGYNTNTLWETTGVDHYALVTDAENPKSRVLYGADKDNTLWIAVRSGIQMPAKTELPVQTAVICDYAFADTTAAEGSYTINWKSLPDLRWIQKGAFTGAAVSGDIVIGDGDADALLQIEDEAFAFCDNITSFSIDKTLHYLGEYVFAGCSQLRTVRFGSVDASLSLYAGLFNYCDALQSLEIDAKTPPMLVLEWGAFGFNQAWTAEEQTEKLKLIVPECAKETYAVAWRYAMGGYATMYNYDGSYFPAFRSLWIDCYNELADSLYSPTNKEVDARAKQRILSLENGLRRMLDTDTVSEPTDLYIWHQNDDQLALAGVPSTARKVTLNPQTLDMPDVWYLDSVEPDAFDGADQLEEVTLLDNLSSIESNAFRGSASKSEKLTLKFKATEPLQLLGGTEDAPFTFGVADDKLHLEVPEGSEAAYIRSWVYPLSGYSDEEEVLAKAKALLEKDGSGDNSSDTDSGNTDSGNTDNGNAGSAIENEAVTENAEPLPEESQSTEPVENAESVESAEPVTYSEEASGEETQPEDTFETQVRRKAAELLLPAENRLRAMMGMDTLNSIDDGMLSIKVPTVTEPDSPEEVTDENEETGGTELMPGNGELEQPGEIPEDTEEQPEEIPEDTKDASEEKPEDSVEIPEETPEEQEPETEASTVTDKTADTSAEASETDKTSDKKETEEKKSQNNSTGATPEAKAATGSRLKEGETE